MLHGLDEIIQFYALFPSKKNANIKFTDQYIIYKQNIYIKQKINAQNLRPQL